MMISEVSGDVEIRHAHLFCGLGAAARGFNRGEARVGSVADPRPGFDCDCREAYQTGGHYGVIDWRDESGTVSGSAKHDNGRWSVADPRITADGAAVNPATRRRRPATISTTIFRFEVTMRW